jgi:hypothetical protein
MILAAATIQVVWLLLLKILVVLLYGPHACGLQEHILTLHQSLLDQEQAVLLDLGTLPHQEIVLVVALVVHADQVVLLVPVAAVAAHLL